MRSDARVWHLCCLYLGIACAGVSQEAPPPASAADTNSAYRVEVHVFRILPAIDERWGDRKFGGSNALALSDHGVAVPVPEPGQRIGSVFGSEIELFVHHEVWKLDKDGLTRKGGNEYSQSRIQAVSSPAIILPLGERAEIRMGQEEAQYFEREVDGVYALRTVDEFVGYTFDCTLTRSAVMEGALSMKISSTLRETGDREPVPGLTLDVGKPTIRETKFETNIQLKPNDWLGSVSRSDDGSLLLTLVTARESGS